MNVLLADHHPLYRQGVQNALKDHQHLHFKWIVEDGNDLLSSIDANRPDLLILEIDLPHSNGIGVLRDLKELHPNLHILVLSSHPEEIYAISAVKAGAHGYLSKTRGAAEIESAITAICNGQTYISEDVLELHEKRKKGTKNRPYRKLSTREIEVLNLLSRGKRNKEISQVLNINEKTVSTYKTRLLKKLNVTNLADLINQARLLQITH